MGKASPSIPPGLPDKYLHHWRYPYGRKARRSRGFKKWLRAHGYLSPNFRIWEAACNDGTPVPKGKLLRNAQRHAFNLERMRHAFGDISMDPISWYRYEEYNEAIGGARFSQHIQACATDFSKAFVDLVGRTRFFEVANKVFKNGGVGDYPGGSAHVDSRGWFARWTSF